MWMFVLNDIATIVLCDKGLNAEWNIWKRPEEKWKHDAKLRKCDDFVRNDRYIE